MKNYFLTGLLLLIIVSCSKDTFQSKPQLTLKSVSTNIVPASAGDVDALQIKFRLTDKEGDFLDTIWFSKITTRCPLSNRVDSNLLSISGDVPRTNNFDGEVEVTFKYLQIQPQCIRPDTAVFSFWMKDKKGNKSDTVRTAPIIILRP